MAGRNPTYSTKFLLEILDKYMQEHKYIVDQVTASEIARYAVEKLGVKDKNGNPIDGRHFRRNEKVKTVINGFNEGNQYNYKSINMESQFVNMKIDNFVEIYSKNPKVMIAILTRFQLVHRELFDEGFDLKKQISELKSVNDKLINELKEIKIERNDYKLQNRNLSKFKSFEKKLKLLEYLKSKGLISTITDENLELISKNCRLIETEDNINSLEVYSVTKTVGDGELIISEEKIKDEKILKLSTNKNTDDIEKYLINRHKGK